MKSNIRKLTLAAAAVCILSAGSAAFSFAGPSALPVQSSDSSCFTVTNSLDGYSLKLPSSSYFCTDSPLSGNTYDFYAQLLGIDDPYPTAASGSSERLPGLTLEEYIARNTERLSSLGCTVTPPMRAELGRGVSLYKISCIQDNFQEDYYINQNGDRFSFLVFRYRRGDEALIQMIRSTLSY
ncbi:hypothetical protein [Clostridium sp. AM58-1XD]|uniref:hypothetical protein n=1 Tax=Clostridium sp. AM58-1XD TaxID=2292307 RepID=UPI000E4A4B84|nr:hypothetical protein [Clostridium sp. AM58-1XD]RGZ00622.1 hypothetical protein DXA13_04055 [Clostridium sp. AM58-1XD]